MRTKWTFSLCIIVKFILWTSKVFLCQGWMYSLLVKTSESPTAQRNTLYYSDSTSLDGKELVKDNLSSLPYTFTSGVKSCSSQQGLILLETSSTPDSLDLSPIMAHTQSLTRVRIMKHRMPKWAHYLIMSRLRYPSLTHLYQATA